MKEQPTPKTFEPFFTGKRNGQYFYRGQVWRGDTNLIGYGKLSQAEPNGIKNTCTPDWAKPLPLPAPEVPCGGYDVTEVAVAS